MHQVKRRSFISGLHAPVESLCVKWYHYSNMLHMRRKFLLLRSRYISIEFEDVFIDVITNSCFNALSLLFLKLLRVIFPWLLSPAFWYIERPVFQRNIIVIIINFITKLRKCIKFKNIMNLRVNTQKKIFWKSEDIWLNFRKSLADWWLRGRLDKY